MNDFSSVKRGFDDILYQCLDLLTVERKLRILRVFCMYAGGTLG